MYCHAIWALSFITSPNALVALDIVVEGRGKAQVFLQVFGADDAGKLLPQRHLLGGDAGHLGNLLFQRTHPALVGVLIHDMLQGFVGERKFIGLEPVLGELLGNQVLMGDLEFFLGQVSAYVDHFHTVLQGRLDAANPVGGGDEQNVREVVVHVQVVVVEGTVLLRIQGFEKRAGRPGRAPT